jgi:hypothetical protein
VARSGRPSFLKKQKEQKRLEKAARKREERQARKAQKAEGVPLETADSPEVGVDEAPSEEPTQLGG